MAGVFLSYSRRDGVAAAVALRRDLTEVGLTVWRDIEEMRGGLDWREQIRAALAAVDFVLVLLTPGAVASDTVAWEWRTALAGGRRVIPLLMRPCEVPEPLARLHYHDFTRPEGQREAMNRLFRDLVGDTSSAASPPAREPDTYVVGQLIGGVAGPSGTVINEGSVVEIGPAEGVTLPDGPATYRIGRAVNSVIGPEGRVENRNTRVNFSGDSSEVILKRVDAALSALVAQQNQATHRLLAGQEVVLAAIRAISSELEQQEAVDVAGVMVAVEAGRVEQGEMLTLLREAAAALRALEARSSAQDAPALPEVAGLAEWIEAPELSVKHKLLLTVPIIPFILSYGGEIEVGQGVNLEGLWRRLADRFRAST